MKGPTKPHHLLALSLMAASFACLPQAQAAQYQIDSGSLAQALTRFAAEAGITLQFSAELTRNLSSPGLAGDYGTEQGLAVLLAGTGLQAESRGDGVYVLVPVAKASQESSGGLQLPATEVSAVYATTEGSGSYRSEIGTTALPFNASLRETPQSVTVITRQMLDDKKIDNLMDVVEHTAGLSLSRYESNRGSMFARGFNINNYLIDGVATRINEQWSAGEVLSNMTIYDRVEVLRGSDGLMTGVGNPSAVINMVRKKADSRELTGSVSVEGGSWQRKGVTLDVSTPLTASGSTRARFVADYDDGDHYMDLRENQEHVLFATLEQDIGDSTLLSFGIHRQDNRTNSPTWGGVPAWIATGPYDGRRADWGRSKTTSTDWSYWDSDYTNWFVRGEHDFGNGWRAKASYTRGERNSESKLVNFYPYAINPGTGTSYLYYDFSGFIFALPQNGWAGMYFVENVKQDINLQLEGQFDLFGRSHELAFGYDHGTERFEADGAPANVGVPPSIFDWTGKVAEPSYIARQNYLDNETTQSAYYAATRLSLADPLKLILGARMIDYEVEDFKTPSNDFKANNELVPYAGLVFDVTDNVSVYASYTSIFEPQRQRDVSNRQLSPIEGNTREYGIKGSFFDNRLSASLSMFRMQQANVAKANGLIPGMTPPQTAYIEIDGTESRGFEAEIMGEILPQWNVSLGYSHFKAKAANGDDVNPLIPRRQFTAFTSYRLPGALHGLTVGGGVRWQSETYAQQFTSPKLEQEAYTLVDLMARYQLDEQWSAQLNLNNVLDKKYYGLTEDAMQVYRQEPRNAQLSVKYEF